MKIIQPGQIIEQWQSLGNPGFYELLVEVPPGDLPEPQEAIEIDGLGGVNVQDVKVGRRQAQGLVRARLDVSLTGA